jgi:hypothetical protein
MGVNAKDAEAQRAGGRAKFGWTGGARDTFRMFGDGFEAQRPEPEQRQVHNMELKSLKTLGLDRMRQAPK